MIVKSTSEKKQAQIDAFLEIPLKAGDPVHVKGLGSRNPEMWGYTTVDRIDGDGIYIKENGSNSRRIDAGQFKKWTMEVGGNPFPKNKDRIQNINFTLDSVLFGLGLTNEKPDKYDIDGVTIKNCNFDPFIFDDAGQMVRFQRPLVWSLEDKQLLLESIYNNIDCGKILIRAKSWEELRALLKKGVTELYWKDVIDGKQRLSTMAQYVMGGFPDANGFYYGDLSSAAQHKLTNHQLFSYAELPENSSDADVRDQFLKLNFAGVPQSKEHIEFVKNINIK